MQDLPRPLAYAIIDEVDHILIDECRTPFYIASSGSRDVSPYADQYKIAKQVIMLIGVDVSEDAHS